METRRWSKHFDGIAPFPNQILVNFEGGWSSKRWQYQVNNQSVIDCLLDTKSHHPKNIIFKSSYWPVSRPNIPLLIICWFVTSFRKLIFREKGWQIKTEATQQLHDWCYKTLILNRKLSGTSLWLACPNAASLRTWKNSENSTGRFSNKANS